MRIRLDKWLANSGAGSRREVNEMIRQGRVLVNGVVVSTPKTIVDTADEVRLDQLLMRHEKYLYFLLHKPKGTVSATRDRRKTVLDLIDEKDRRGHALFPVGRLDMDTTGLLLMTDDGRLAHRLLSPRYHVEKVYIATLDGPVNPEMVRIFSEGIPLMPEKMVTKPALLEPLEERQARVTIQEGKYHQVKRMFHYCGREVEALHRVRMGPLSLGSELQEGAYRPLLENEKRDLLALATEGDGEDGSVEQLRLEGRNQ